MTPIACIENMPLAVGSVQAHAVDMPMELANILALPPRVRILVGDNEETIATTLAAILDLAGCEVCALYAGEAALRLLNLFQAQFDLVDLSSRAPAVPLACTSPLQVRRCKVLLFTGQTRFYDLLQTEAKLNLPFELLVCPVRAAELLARLRSSLCSEHPPLLIPFETAQAEIH